MSNIPVIGTFIRQYESFQDKSVTQGQKAKMAVATAVFIGGLTTYIVGLSLSIQLSEDMALQFSLQLGGGIVGIAAYYSVRRFTDQAEVMRGIRHPDDVLDYSLFGKRLLGPGVEAPAHKQEPLTVN